ncbi:Testis-expressed protein 9 [Frankliniella fusca]|uniref:Testis-expressed protein 9 n=1 Tax=Frankliniella fusca TaxID=407009 RepID=A0AAE1LTE7_9NEOP|nr:Testis-expressed protein 9 [Frankliniella fusca]
MEKDLLMKEEEFHKINNELEERTSRILKEIDAAKGKAGLLGDNLHQGNHLLPNHSKAFSLKCDSSILKSSMKDEKGIPTKNKKESIEDPLAIRSNGLGYEATNRLLRAKLTILNKEVDTLRQDYKTKSEECRKLSADLTRSEEEGARLESSLATARDASAGLQSKIESISRQLNQSQAENLSLNKELVAVKKELKSQKHQSSATELRLNRALEDIEKLRNTAKQAQLQVKEDRESQRKVGDQLQSKIKNLERQRTELMSVCTKQLHLIDNLRRQKVHLEVTRFVTTAETEFDNILDWCLKNENDSVKPKP